MRVPKFLVLVFCCILAAGCQRFFKEKDAVWELVTEVFIISSPYKVDGKEVVALIWPESESPTQHMLKIGDLFQIGWGRENTSGIWNGYPAKMVPALLRGKVLCKKIRLKYRIIKNEGVPLVEIKELTII